MNLSSETLLESVLFKVKFWDRHGQVPLNDRQRLMLNKFLDGFDGKLTSSKWAKITKSSQDTALCDMNDLVEKGYCRKRPVEAGVQIKLVNK